MKKSIIILLSVLGSLAVLSSVFWSVLAICTNREMDKLFKDKADT